MPPGGVVAGPTGDSIYRQEIDSNGTIHYYEKNGDEIFPAFHPVHSTRWKALTTWIIVFSAAVIFTLIINNRTRDKQDKEQAARSVAITQILQRIQKSRAESCRRNYESIRTVFKPLIPPPSLQSPAQKKSIAKFNAAVDANKRKCGKQTSIKGSP